MIPVVAASEVGPAQSESFFGKSCGVWTALGGLARKSSWNGAPERVIAPCACEKPDRSAAPESSTAWECSANGRYTSAKAKYHRETDSEQVA